MMHRHQPVLHMGGMGSLARRLHCPIAQPTFWTVAVLAPAPFSPADSATTRRWERGRATVGAGALRAWETVQAIILTTRLAMKGACNRVSRSIIAD